MRGAVAAQRALDAYPWPGGELVRVRMGIHAGEVRLVDGDYVGFEVHRAARVASAAHGGQVLVSGTARALAGDPGDDITLRDLGEVALKDLDGPERLFQAEAPGLRADFPPLRVAGSVAGNLPAQLTSFIGRAEVARAEALLGTTRLLTLRGPTEKSSRRPRTRRRGPSRSSSIAATRSGWPGRGSRAGSPGRWGATWGGAAADVAVCLREFQANRDVSGLVLTMAAMSSLLLIAGRDEDAYMLGAAAERATAETGLHIASLWATPSMQVPDLAGATGPLRAAMDRGRALSREEALEQALAIAGVLAAGPPGTHVTK